MAINPHTFRMSTIDKSVGLETIQLKKSDNIHCEFFKYSADVHPGIIAFDIPSYSTCQPIKNLKMRSMISCKGEYVSFFFNIVLLFIDKAYRFESTVLALSFETINNKIFFTVTNLQKNTYLMVLSAFAIL